MKKFLIFIILNIGFYYLHAQSIDTVYHFFPKLAKQFDTIKKLDSTCRGSYCVHFQNEAGSKYLEIIVYKKLKLISEGKYVKDNEKPKTALIIDSKTGEVIHEVRKVDLYYIREGYWYDYRKNKIKQIYFNKGKKLKIKI